MDADRDFVIDSKKDTHKSYEVDFRPVSQEGVEELIRNHMDHISGIFGIDVCPPASSPTVDKLNVISRQMQLRYSCAT